MELFCLIWTKAFSSSLSKSAKAHHLYAQTNYSQRWIHQTISTNSGKSRIIHEKDYVWEYKKVEVRDF